MVNATGCTSVWGSTYPFNPYPFPWTNHLFQDSASMALGIFEGHMAKMAEGFKTIRLAEAELAGRDHGRLAEELAYFGWQDFSDDEWKLCPPVVAVGGDGAMYDIGFQNLSRAMMSGKPIKILVVDTQVYSNTGGQACTSGFLGQVSDMAQFGPAQQGKEEIRKEIGLIGMAHRTTYVLQSTIAHANHMIEGFVHGLQTRRPALFNIYSSCQPEHGIGDDASARQAKLAVESRAYPLFSYDPDKGRVPSECFDLRGNPAPEQTWPTYSLAYREGGISKSMELPMTFADFAITEARFRKHFRMAPPDTWNDQMVPLHAFLELDPAEREGRFPFVWTVDREGQLSRLLVDAAMVASTEDRRDFWAVLRELSEGPSRTAPPEAIEKRIRDEVIQKIAANLMRIATGEEIAGDTSFDLTLPATTVEAEARAAEGAEPGAEATAASSTGASAEARTGASAEASAAADSKPAADGYMAPWIDTDQCTTCDECINVNAKIFAYNEKRKAIIKDPKGGPYADLVTAAERCTASIIHPGLPADRSAPDVDKWIARGERFN
jgi:pyruvate-ferredoxin/flavodoxin oxidoreductase